MKKVGLPPPGSVSAHEIAAANLSDRAASCDVFDFDLMAVVI